MVGIKLDTTQAIADMRRIAQRIDTAGFAGWKQVLREATNMARGHGYEDRTGFLSRSMKGETMHRGRFDWEGAFVARAPYAQYVDKPTRAHAITAHGSGMLRFFWARFGCWVVTKEVWHPGTKGAQFSAEAKRLVEAWAPVLIERSVSRDLG